MGSSHVASLERRAKNGPYTGRTARYIRSVVNRNRPIVNGGAGGRG